MKPDESILAECEALENEDGVLVALMSYGSNSDTEKTAKNLPENEHSLKLLHLAKRLVTSLSRTGKLSALLSINNEIKRRTKLEIEKPATLWEVISNDDVHELYFEGKSKASMRGNAGLKVLTNCMEVFTRNGSTPGKKLKILCAADAKNAAAFLEKRSHHSPELPLENLTLTPSIMSENSAPIVQLFPASHFVRFPTNRNIDEESIIRMHESVKEVGVINPLIARPIPGKSELEIIAGETRWLGCKRIGPEFMVPTFLKELTDKEAAKIHAIDNFQRKSLNAIEEGTEMKHMLDCGWNLDEIAGYIGKSVKFIYKRFALIKLPEAGKIAYLEGNLSQNTADRIMALPEELREPAIQAVISPTHAASALPEREAMSYIQKNFVLPMEKAKEWEEKKKLLMQENPGAVWLEYEKAKKAQQNFSRADQKPRYDLLSDAARHQELVVPFWEELASKHGSPIYIGLSYQDEPALFIDADPIVDAEKALMNDKPEDCIFTHEKCVQKTRDAAEKRKMEDAAKREAQALERKKLQNFILAPDGIKPAAMKKLVGTACFLVLENGAETHMLDNLFEIPESEDQGKKLEAAIQKYLKSKAMTPLEALARISLATCVDSYNCDEMFEHLFDSEAIKITDYPQHAAICEAKKIIRAAQEAEEAQRLATRNQEKADRIARGEEETA